VTVCVGVFCMLSDGGDSCTGSGWLSGWIHTAKETVCFIAFIHNNYMDILVCE